HADVVAEVLPAELGADADLLGELEDLLLEFDVTEAPPGDVALAGELVEVVGGGQLGGLDRVLGRGPPDDDRQVIRRACRGPERAELLIDELHPPIAGYVRVG